MTEHAQGRRVEDLERTRVHAGEVSWALRELTRAAADVEHRLARSMRLRAIDYAALGHVMSADEGIGPVELSERLGISSGSGTELVDRLERAGHIRRDRHPQDRRRLVLHMSDEAVDLVIGELRPMIAQLDEIAAAFSPEEQEAIHRYLRATARSMSEFADRHGTGPVAT